MSLEDVARRGVRILNAKQVKKLQPGAMVRVFIETKKGVTDTIAMVTQVGIHKRLMTMDASATMIFTISCLCKQHVKAVLEMLDYGIMRGFGQWRNSGKGRFGYELLGKTEEAMDVGNVVDE